MRKAFFTCSPEEVQQVSLSPCAPPFARSSSVQDRTGQYSTVQ